jgi:adenine-specific DNA-methyltransferase
MLDMKAELSKIGASTMHPLGAIGRYRPNKAASNTAPDVNEFLVVVERPEAQLPKAQPEAIKATKPILVESYA